MPGEVTLVGVGIHPHGGLLLLDAKGTQHHVEDGPELWSVLTQILSDPTQPRMENVRSDQAAFEDGVAEVVAGVLPPGARQLSKPFVRSFMDGLQRFSRATRRKAQP